MMAAKGEGNLPHRPVLYQEIIHALGPQRGMKFVDGTIGAGGHAWGLLEGSGPDGLLLGLDVDPQALVLAGERLAEFGTRTTLAHASYTTLPEQLERLGWKEVDGILLDLGASSMQFDTPERGFSFMQDGPLDMRFNPDAPFTAADIVNTWAENDIADILFHYGEERRSRQIAKAICQTRPLESTQQLAAVVEKNFIGPNRSRIHPATRTFQALRIAVNGELEAVEEVLPLAVDALASGGRLAVIAFHSLEDRIVKRYFHQISKDQYAGEHPLAPLTGKARVRLVNRKPLGANEEEIALNPRSRSAKLRVVERL